MSDRYQLHKSGHMDRAVHCTKVDIEERLVMPKDTEAIQGPDLKYTIRYAATLKYLAKLANAELAEELGVSIDDVADWETRPEWEAQTVETYWVLQTLPLRPMMREGSRPLWHHAVKIVMKFTRS
jgi:hypothetical protein